MLIPKIIWYISVWSVLLPFLTGILLYRRLDHHSRIIFAIVVAAIPPQLLTLPFPHSGTLDILYNIYTILEFVLVYFLFAGSITGTLKKAFLAPFFPFLAFVTYSIYSQGLKPYFNEWVCAANIAYLYWMFLFVLECLDRDMKWLDTGLPIFWYCSALILYAPCTVFVFSLYAYIDRSTNPFIHRLWSIHGIFNTSMYVMFAIGLARNPIRIKNNF